MDINETDSLRSREWFLGQDTLKPIRLIELASVVDESTQFQLLNFVNPIPGSKWEGRLGNIVSAIRRGELQTDESEGREKFRPVHIEHWDQFAKGRKQGDWQWLRDFCAGWSKLAQMPLDTERPIGTKERKSYQTLIVAMAFGGYGYNPKDVRSPIAGDIQSDADKLGLSLDAKTIRKHLEAASAMVSSDHWPSPM